MMDAAARAKAREMAQDDRDARYICLNYPVHAQALIESLRGHLTAALDDLEELLDKSLLIQCDICPVGSVRADEIEDLYCGTCRSVVCAVHAVAVEPDHVRADHEAGEG